MKRILSATAALAVVLAAGAAGAQTAPSTSQQVTVPSTAGHPPSATVPAPIEGATSKPDVEKPSVSRSAVPSAEDERTIGIEKKTDAPVAKKDAVKKPVAKKADASKERTATAPGTDAKPAPGTTATTPAKKL